MNKRLLIKGEGALGEARIDHRSNAPAFRISRSCVLHGIDIDMTGFREAVKVEGTSQVQPLIQNCIIRYTIALDITIIREFHIGLSSWLA